MKNCRPFLLAATLVCTAAALFAEDLIIEVKMPPREKKHHLYPGIQNFTIQDNMFLRDGKPTFVSGGWQLDMEAPVWRFRLFSVDVCTYNPEFIFTCYGLKKGADGVKRLQLAPNPWFEAMINRFLSNKVNFWQEHKAAKINHLTDDPNFKDASGGGHFVAFDPYHPLGVPLYRELYKTWMRYTQNYPIFCYELFNEMSYDNTHAISRNAFRDSMRNQYRTIQALNKAWNSRFASFDDVDAPGYLSDHGTKNIAREKFYLEECTKYPALMVEWQKFQEARCAEAVRKLMPIMRSYDPDPKVFSTLQSEMAWWMDHTGSGVGTKAMTSVSDFYSHEIGTGLIESGNYRSYPYAAKMIRTGFVGDLVRGFNPNRPVYNAEAPLTIISRGVSEDDLRANDFATMTSGWKFFDATAAAPENWNAEHCSTENWGAVRVPDMWGKNGYVNCQVGLYRKEFRLSPAQLENKVYLNGKALADSGEIYINGKPAGSVTGFNTPFTFDITPFVKAENSIAIRIVNRYFHNGMYYGGIRGFIAVNGARLIPDKAAAFEPRHFRTYYWSQMAHGAMNGLMLSYNPPQHTMAARSLPLIKREIENVADLIYLKENQPVPEVAMLYPYESMHTVLHKDYMERLEGPATINILPWYTPFVFHGNSPAVMLPEVLRKNAGTGLKLLVAPNHLRFSPESWKTLCRFVENGGVLVTNYDSFTINDETHAAFDPSVLTGVTFGRKIRNPEYDLPGFGKGRLKQRHLDKTFGRELIPGSAKPYLNYADGRPAVTVNRHGKGKVYVVGANFDYKVLEKLLTGLGDEVKLRRFLRLAPAGKSFLPEFVDLKCWTAKNGSRLVYALNYDVSGSAKLHIPGLAKGNFRMRNVENARTIPAPSGREFWTAEELNAGIPMRLGQFSPVVILLEPAGLAPREFKGIAPTRLAMLNRLWVKPPEIAGGPKIGFTPLDVMNPTHGTFPTALQLVADNGFNIEHLPEDSRFRNVDVVMYSHPRLECRNPDDLLEFVRNGGGLMMMGSGALTYHVLSSNRKIMRAFGLEQGYIPAALYNRKPNLPEEDCLNVRCEIVPGHPVTEHVKEFVTANAGILTRIPKNAKVLLRAPKDDPSYPGRPVAVAFVYGKGRVIYMSDYWFVRPLHINRGDDAQFFLNAMNWLARRNTEKLSAADLKQSLYITKELLEQAEREEAAGITVFTPPEEKASVLENSDFSKTEGLQGGDPIVDAMKYF